MYLYAVKFNTLHVISGLNKSQKDKIKFSHVFTFLVTHTTAKNPKICQKLNHYSLELLIISMNTLARCFLQIVEITTGITYAYFNAPGKDR